MISVDWHPDDKKVKQFSVVCLILCVVIAYFMFRSDATASAYIVAIIGISCLLVGGFRPSWFRPVYYVLSAMLFPLGWVLSNLMLVMVFFVLITPLAMVFKLMGRDALTLSKPRVSSYWKHHAGQRSIESYFRQG